MWEAPSTEPDAGNHKRQDTLIKIYTLPPKCTQASSGEPRILPTPDERLGQECFKHGWFVHLLPGGFKDLISQ